MYGYGYKYSSGLVLGAGGGAPFLNTYSLDFDGIDDKIELGNPTDLQITGAFSFSCWVNTTSTNYEGIYFKGNSVALSDIYIRRQNNGTVRFFINNLSKNVTSSTTVNNGNWHHIMCVYVPSTSMTIYIDGSQDAQNTTSIPSAINNNYGNISIGEGGAQFFNGKIDEASIFNTDQSANISSIYNSGTPNDLTSLSPIAWYRNGDNGSYKSPQWLIPSNENKDKVSNYSFAFDGIDDRLSISEVVYSGAFTFSFWAKPNVFSFYSFVCGDYNSNSYFIWLYSSTQVWLNTNAGNYIFTEMGGNNIVIGDWQNIVITRDSSNNINCYRNGVSFGTSSNLGGNFEFNSIGKIYSLSGSRYFNGGLNEFAVWDNDQSSNIATIYNGGEPTTINGAVAHYKMGEDATFSGGVWTVPDAVGSNDGTSNAMTIEDRIGEAPNSSNNALSFNMDEVDRVTDVPT